MKLSVFDNLIRILEPTNRMSQNLDFGDLRSGQF